MPRLATVAATANGAVGHCAPTGQSGQARDDAQPSMATSPRVLTPGYCGSDACPSPARPASGQRSGACSPRLPGVAARTRPPYSPWPLGGVERPRRKVRFARLMQRRVRDLGGPSAGAAFGGNLSPPWLPRTVVRTTRAGRSATLRARGWALWGWTAAARTRRPWARATAARARQGAHLPSSAKAASHHRLVVVGSWQAAADTAPPPAPARPGPPAARRPGRRSRPSAGAGGRPRRLRLGPGAAPLRAGPAQAPLRPRRRSPAARRPYPAWVLPRKPAGHEHGSPDRGDAGRGVPAGAWAARGFR